MYPFRSVCFMNADIYLQSDTYASMMCLAASIATKNKTCTEMAKGKHDKATRAKMTTIVTIPAFAHQGHQHLCHLI